MGALTKITHRAKAIRKKHPGMAWKSAVKKAGAEYRAGKISGTRKRRTKKARVYKRKRAVRKLKRLHRAEGKALTAIGSVQHHKSAIRSHLKDRIANAAGRRELAIKKNERKKLTRQIAKLKRDYRAYC